jgi:hypothetical protein
MLEKMKSTADNARDKSFAMDHVKSELEVSSLIVCHYYLLISKHRLYKYKQNKKKKSSK